MTLRLCWLFLISFCLSASTRCVVAIPYECRGDFGPDTVSVAVQTSLPDDIASQGSGHLEVETTDAGAGAVEVKWHTGFDSGNCGCGVIKVGEGSLLLEPVPGKHVSYTVTLTGTGVETTPSCGQCGSFHLVLYCGDVIPSVCDSGDCSKCSPSCNELSTHSLDINFGVGKYFYGDSMAHLKIHSDVPSLRLATPAALVPSITAMPAGYGWDLVSQGHAPRQVLTRESLADIVSNTNFRYEIRLYALSDVGSKSDDGYQISSNAVPYRTIVVENPDASTNVYNRLRITEVENSITNSSEFAYTNQVWTLASGNGTRFESRETILELPNSNRVDTVVISNATGQVVSKVIERWQNFAWGSNLVQRIVDPDGAALTNQWIYYGDVPTNNFNYRHLKMKVEPSGYWERYEYDASGISKTVAQFLNASTNAAENSCRVTAQTHTNIAPNVTTVVSLLGQEIARSYRVDFSSGSSNIQCQTAGAALTASDNLITIRQRWNTGSWFRGEPLSVQRPDGTMTLYSYNNPGNLINDSKVITRYEGAANSDGSAVTNGTKTVTTIDSAGHVLSEITYDVANPSLVVADSTVTTTDQFGRATTTVNLAGTNTTSYSCCGVESAVDEDGISTSYTYDNFRRVTTTTRAGISAGNGYDVEGRVLTTTRNGVLMSSNTYSLAGQFLSATDALTNTTTYSETRNASNETVKTTTYPNSTTRIETYYQDGQLKSVTGTAVHGMRNEYGVEQDGGVDRRYMKEIKLNANDTDSSEWTKTYFDMLDRAYKTVFADGAYSQSFYNSKGQLSKQVDPDGVTTLFAHNDRGELETTALDMDQDGNIDTTETDRIAKNASSVVSAHGTTVRRTTTTIWTTSGSGATITAGVFDNSVDGLKSWQIAYGLTNAVASAIDRGSAQRTSTATAPDGSYVTTVYQNGRLQSVTRKDSGNVQIGATTYGYDANGRMTTNSDARTGATIYSYNAADQQTSVSAGGRTTSYLYDSAGRRTRTTLPDSGTVTYAYSATGEIATNSGARTYPVVYTYDYASRMKTLKTWKDFAGNSGTATTTWNYDAARGFLTSKVYDDSSSVTYSNTPGGRLSRRTWARSITTDYTYNNAGELTGIAYSDSTPSVASVYDRRGRRLSVTNGTAICTYTYNDAGQVLTETFPVAGVTITNSYDGLLRRSNLAFTGQSTSYGYDGASRLTNVTDSTHSAAYIYVPNSPLVSNITFKTSGTTKMTTTKNYDNLNRLTAISSQPSAGNAVSFGYQYNDANQRTKRTDADASYWDYTYDALGQVTSGHRKWSDNSSVAGQQYDYNFDDIGNRETATINSHVGTYTANSLNQYSQRTVPGYATELGNAATNATVTVNNQSTTRHSDYFFKELAVTNSSSAVFTQLVSVGVLKNAGSNQFDIVSTTTGKFFVAKSPELFGYDIDGNLTNDGRWVYSWDGENRLIEMQTLASITSSVPKQKLIFSYDSQSRRTSKIVSNWSGSAWAVGSNLKFVYDRWNLLAELDSTNGLARSYTWGLDLSRSEQGAGGIGGLLVVNAGTNNQFAAFDGNGNVMALIDTSSGSMTGQYDYDPFGGTLKTTGAAASLNPIRFSTKYTDETGLPYYGYRYYSANSGRWLSRDPIEEHGGRNIYGFVRNSTVDECDPLGLTTTQELNEHIKNRQRDASKKCCADKTAIVRSMTIDGNTVAADKVHGFVSDITLQQNGPVFDLELFFTDCYHLGQWTESGYDYYTAAEPGFWSFLEINDPYHLAMDAMIIYDVCENGRRKTYAKFSNTIEWTWTSSGWSGPSAPH